MSVFSGNFPKITKHLSDGNHGPLHDATAPGDYTVDAHQTVVGGRLNEVAAHPEIAALFKSWGWDGVAKLDTSASGADELFLRQHRESAGGRSLISVLWEKGKALKFWGVPSEGDSAPADPSQPYPNQPTPAEAEEDLKSFGFITSATDWGSKLGRKWYLDRYFQNKLTPETSEAWAWENHKRKRLPEQYIPRESFIPLFDALEHQVTVWGLATATNAADLAAQQEATRVAYFAWEASFLPEDGETPATPSFGDRVVNPRSLIYAGRFIENAIVLGNPTSAVVSGPRAAMYLGQPQHFSRFEMYGMHQSAQPLQKEEWQALLGRPVVGGGGGGLHVGGR